MINFEQLCEEARAVYPGANVVSACERPLSLAVDGIPVDTNVLLTAHDPCRLRLDKPAIRADGVDARLLVVDYPARAGGTVALTLRHGDTAVQQVVELDERGCGELEVASTTAGEIVIAVAEKPVRISLQVGEV